MSNKSTYLKLLKEKANTHPFLWSKREELYKLMKILSGQQLNLFEDGSAKQ